MLKERHFPLSDAGFNIASPTVYICAQGWRDPPSDVEVLSATPSTLDNMVKSRALVLYNEKPRGSQASASSVASSLTIRGPPSVSAASRTPSYRSKSGNSRSSAFSRASLHSSQTRPFGRFSGSSNSSQNTGYVMYSSQTQTIEVETIHGGAVQNDYSERQSASIGRHPGMHEPALRIQGFDPVRIEQGSQGLTATMGGSTHGQFYKVRTVAPDDDPHDIDEPLGRSGSGVSRVFSRHSHASSRKSSRRDYDDQSDGGITSAPLSPDDSISRTGSRGKGDRKHKSRASTHVTGTSKKYHYPDASWSRRH